MATLEQCDDLIEELPEEPIFVGSAEAGMTELTVLSAEEGQPLLERFAAPGRKPTPMMLEIAARYKRLMSENRSSAVSVSVDQR